MKRAAQLKDETCQKLTDYVLKGWPSKKEVDTLYEPYWRNRYEILVQDGLLLRDCKIIITKSHQAEKGNWEILQKTPYPRSYLVQSGKRVCRRNRKHLIPSPNFHPEPEPEDDVDVKGYQHSPANAYLGSLPLMSSPQSPKTYSERARSSTEASPYPYVTKSGRTVRPPEKLGL
ncbi:hypothetical protein AVEN_140898-1 [Araneus ventricosus]|uniref:DUF5641 domain-containing protein n=1 Tax=Araneus ventricosus TaxID=182803 RepID=A0A4Y2HVE8_ARAVE|nr:hypothetical protein AVEN_140898-1 [Araneus ventricosus]